MWLNFYEHILRTSQKRYCFNNRLKRAGFLPQEAPTVESLANRADDALFKAIISEPKHVLRRMCHERQESRYNLRLRPHPFALPAKDSKNFLPRQMFKNIY